MRALDHQPFTDDERLVLEKLEQLLASATSAKLLIESEEATLPVGVIQLLYQMVHHRGEGTMFFVRDEEEVLTTQEAANMLHVSRPYLIKLLEKGEIPFTKVGLHRRVRSHDVIEYLKRREEKEEEGLRKLAQLSQEYGLYD
jgi:excisionase family DNA binding protein